MRLTIADVGFEILGDPHRGRVFRTGVPLHRLGDREEMQSVDFKASLDNTVGAHVHVCMGDLFDKPKVSNEIVAQVADEYLGGRTPGVEYVCLPGNHDISRNTEVVSSFELFAKIVGDAVLIPQRKPIRRLYGTADVVFIPWHPTDSARKVVEDHAEMIRGADAVFGHWDVDGRLEGTDNYVPADLFAELGVDLIITGHDHICREMTIAGLRVIVTGAMQPYSHSEDPEGKIYITMNPDEAQLALRLDPEVFKDNCLRIVGEWEDEIPDCLQFKTVTEVVDADIEDAMESVQVAEFSMKDLWSKAFAGVDPDVAATLAAKFAELDGEME